MYSLKPWEQLNMTEVGDCRPICTRCSEAIEIDSVREDGWIYLKPHKCKPQLQLVPDTDDAPCTECRGSGWDRLRERVCDCTADPTGDAGG